MPNIKAVVIRRSGGSMTNRIMTTPKSVNVLQEGLRASDSMTMMLSGEHAVQQGDEVYYIQDVLDVTNLKAVWNFYGGFRDESGYEHDDVYTAPHTMPNCVASTLVSSVSQIDWSHKGYYKFNISANSNDGVQIEKKFKNNDTSVSKIPVIDMSGDFDMIFQFKTTSSTDGQTLFDNYDHATSSGTGLKIVINPTSTNITITADDGTTETIMVAGSITTLNTVTFVRIRRQGGVFKLYLDGVEKTLTNSTNAGNLNSNQNIHFFKEYNESTSAYLANTGWVGVPIQFRFYNTVLLDDEVKKLRISKPVNTTMKFGGRIWKLEDKGRSKKLSCSSHSKELLGTQISASLFTTTNATIGSGLRVNNRYYHNGSGRPDMEEIIQDLLKYIDGGVYSYFAKDPSTNFQGDFIAEGSFLDVLKVMMIVDPDDHIFVVTPRKILFISDEPSTNQIVNNQLYDIVDSGKDDTGTTNSLYVTGRKKTYTNFKEYTSLVVTQNSWSTPQTFLAQDFFTPVVEKMVKVTRAGVEIYGDFRVGTTSTTVPTTDTYRLLEDNTIQFWNDSTGNTQTWTIVYEYTYTYDPTASYSLAQASTQHRSDTASIALNGLYHRNINVPQIVSGYDIITFITKYLTDHKLVNTRQRLITSSLVNSLTVGQKVRYTDSLGVHSDQVVRSIEYSYPQTLTVIELGEFMFSGFDVEKQTTESLRGLDSSTNISRY